MLKQAILEAIAEFYSTTVKEVSRDVHALSRAKEALEQFCEAMEDAGY